MRTSLIGFAIGLGLAALLVPVLAAAVPPLADYPNHLSRLWLLGGGAAVPPVSGMYRITWDTLTNIGIDVLAVALTRLFSYDLVGRLFIAAAVLAPPLGGVVLWRVLHGRLHWWQISFGLLAWSMGLLAGFLNFEIGLGLALLAVAADAALSRRGAAAAVAGRVASGGALLLVHAFAFAFYAALLCGIAIGPEFHRLLRRGPLRGICRSVLVIAATLAVPVALLAVVAPSLPGAQTGTNLHTLLLDFRYGLTQLRMYPGSKFTNGFLGVRAYATWLDALTLAALGLPVVVSLASRRLTVHAGMLAVTLGLVACYVVVPAYLAGTYWIDRRFALMAPLTLAAALRPDMPLLAARPLAAALLTVSLVRTSVIGWVWHDRQTDVVSMARALAPVPPGAAILPVEHRSEGFRAAPIGRYTTMNEPSYRHLPTLALPWRRAFVPTLFTARGKQPLLVLPPWDEIAVPEGGWLASVDALVDAAVFARDVERAPYLKLWRQRFDYVLVVNADLPDLDGRFVPPPGVELMKDEGFAQLYRINRASPGDSRE